MAPKRRKLSLGDNETSNQDAKRLKVENYDPESDVKFFSTEEKIENAKDKANEFKAFNEGSSDMKPKDDCPRPIRISERLSIKRNRLGDTEESDGANQLTTKAQTPPKKPKTARQPSKKNKKKIRRPWAQWSLQDKRLFFLGLGEFGKNFEAISNKISHASKMQGLPVKDKTQVRYFYYRTWAKISKFVHMTDIDVKMKTQEMYGLINYGVLKKYVKETDPQFERCLNELIQYGETSFISRGKRQRLGKVRTPICTYLKKLNRIEATEPSNLNKLPTHITLELTPKNSKSWAKVQAMSQNPRVRMKVTSNRTLESVFKYLDQKWKPLRLRLKEGLGATEVNNDELVFFLHPSCKIKPVTLIPQEQQKIDIAFKSYRENILPTLIKNKKPKATKEPEQKVFKEADKSAEEKAPETTAADEGNDHCPAKSRATLATEAFIPKANGEQMSSFSCLLTAAGVADVTVTTPISSQSTLTAPPVLLEDENAMFPDDAPFSPPQPMAEALNSPVIMSSPPPASVLSPYVQSKKKSGKSSKKQLPVEEPTTFNSDHLVSDNSTSPAKNDCPFSVSVQDLKEESEKEIDRLKHLTTEGFNVKNSHNVTFLHLSILLGRESTIKIEYEWKDKNPSKLQLPPLLCQASSQMSNVLRRLCNIATLELSDYKKPCANDQNKSQVKSVPCAHCGRDGPTSKSRNNRRQVLSERKEKMKEMSTMTDPMTSPVNHLQAYQPLPSLVSGARTFVAAPPPSGSIQIISPDPVFRVPIVPNYKPVLSREEQQRLEEQQKLQAKEIIQQAPNSRRLLKKRGIPRKPSSSIIVQRSLVPKVDTANIVTYIQQPLAKPVVVRMGPEKMMKSAQAVNIICSAAPMTVTTANLIQVSATASIHKEVHQIPFVNDSEKSGVYTSVSPASVTTASVLMDSGPIMSPFTVNLAPELSVNVQRPSSPKNLDTTLSSSQGDISMSDFDISLSAAADCTMGSDAGDKFLDLVLPSSEQGFSGLLSTPKKSTRSDEEMDSGLNFGTPILRTPTHTGSPMTSFSHNPIIFPSPLKLDTSSQSWLSAETGDVSLSSILGDSSSFKTQPNLDLSTSTSEPQLTQPVTSSALSFAFFDNESSDANFSTVLTVNKSVVSDISLSSLLGDPSFRKEDSQQQTSPPTPPLSSSANVKSLGIFSGGLDTESSSQLFGEGSQDSFAKLDVEGLVNDASLDLVRKFESLAAQMSESNQQLSGLGTDKMLLTVDNAIQVESSRTGS